ncbi:RNA-dependent RNA polymerase 1 [Zea mays]|uniref:RNA-dependent RNA polymerase 1 n=2 Tax=Zea mays TaxID=4577 RepID=A0A1D6HJL4_MAIZE|nr:RNA-dependent RNA polymerase 1 [Zea mays]
MERTRDSGPPATGSKVGGPSSPGYLMTVGRGLVVVGVGMWSYGVVICTMVGRTIQVQGFALTDSAESVKLFLERIAGAGTICALKLRHPRNISANSRAFAIVQFQSQESASLVENAAQRQVLKIGRFYLRTRPADRDIVPRPRIPMFSLEDIVLHLGCLVKENILSALFRASNVSVQFGFDMKKIYFYLSYNFTKFKLELSYESIWEMQLHRPPAYRSRTQFLLIQVGFSYNLPFLDILADFRLYLFNLLKRYISR